MPKKSNVQAAAKRRVVAMDFNNKRKLDASQVRDRRKGTLVSVLIPGGNNRSYTNGLAPYKSNKKKFKRNDQA